MAQTIYEFFLAIYHSDWLRRRIYQGYEFWALDGLEVTFWWLSFTNGTLLVAHYFKQTNSVITSFWLQQFARAFLIITFTALLSWHPDAFRDIWLMIDGTLHIAISVTLWYLILTARWSQDLDLGQWTVDVGDLTAGKLRYNRISKRISYGGVTQTIGRFLSDALFRRVSPVETRLYAVGQHVFALMAIGLLLTRIITLVRQLDDERLPSRTRIEPCWGWPVPENASDTATLSSLLVIRRPEQRSLAKGIVPDNKSQPYRVSVVFQASESISVSQVPVTQCNQELRKTNPDAFNYTDWFWVYSCDIAVHARAPRFTKFNSPGFYYSIEIPATNNSIPAYDMPDFWMIYGKWDDSMLAPYISPPFQPVQGMYTVFQTHPAQRKFISSSAWWDAITGSKPTYNTSNIYLWSLASSRPILPNDNSNTTVLASGFIRWPAFLDSSPYTARGDLRAGTRGPDDLCQVIEEYRTGGAFDILASIGGLLALLQGLHIFLFGRPLFWGLFGSKFIAPFGFVGRFVTQNFRKRLWDHYYSPISRDPPATGGGAVQADHNLNITQFLLDYVLDLGPAARPTEVVIEVPREHARMQHNNMVGHVGPALQRSNDPGTAHK